MVQSALVILQEIARWRLLWSHLVNLHSYSCTSHQTLVTLNHLLLLSRSDYQALEVCIAQDMLLPTPLWLPGFEYLFSGKRLFLQIFIEIGPAVMAHGSTQTDTQTHTDTHRDRQPRYFRTPMIPIHSVNEND